MRRFLAAGLLLSIACGTPQPPASEPTAIFAAVSLKSALDDLDATVFRRDAIQVRLTYAGTPQRARQIEAGAPADLIISADDRWMDALAGAGHVQADTRITLLGNTLVVVAPASSAVTLEMSSTASWRAALADGRLALAEPETVPAGRYAKAALISRGVWPSLADRLAPHENIRAALAVVARGEAPLGIVYGSDAAAEPKVRVVQRFEPSDHAPIHYPAALTRAARPAARDVLRRLQSPDARAIFERHGFTTPAR